MNDSRPSKGAHARAQLDALWRAVHQQSTPTAVQEICRTLVPDEPPNGWRSFVSDDHTPYEHSLLLGSGGCEIRLMAEPMLVGRAPSIESSIAAARELEPKLAAFGASFRRLEQVRDLFLTDVPPESAFAIWYGAVFDREGRASFKVYLNPLVRGVHESPALVEETLARLGFAGAWATVSRTFERGWERDSLRFLSLDLLDDASARVKVYGFMRQSTDTELATSVHSATGTNRDAALAFCREIAGGSGLLDAGRDPCIALAFVAGEKTPRTATLHVPVRAFAANDAVANQRVKAASTALGVDSGAYSRALEALVSRPLEAGSGAVAWAGVRLGKEAPRLNVYLAPRWLHDAVPHAGAVPGDDPNSIRHVVERNERDSITAHPVFRRLAAQGDLDKPVVGGLLLSIQHAITRDFARRLASVVARVDEDDIRSMIAKQLDDELGSGKPEKAHKLLFDRFAAGVAGWQDNSDDFAAAKQLYATMEELYLHRSPYEGLGATLIMECVGKQFDIFLGQLLRQHRAELSESVLEWLTSHETLEVDHVDESLQIALRVPPGTKERLAVRGANELSLAITRYLDQMYERHYG